MVEVADISSSPPIRFVRVHLTSCGQGGQRQLQDGQGGWKEGWENHKSGWENRSGRRSQIGQMELRRAKGERPDHKGTRDHYDVMRFLEDKGMGRPRGKGMMTRSWTPVLCGGTNRRRKSNWRGGGGGGGGAGGAFWLSVVVERGRKGGVCGEEGRRGRIEGSFSSQMRIDRGVVGVFRDVI